MITTIQEVIKNQGWKQGQMVETDLWLGLNCIHHIAKVMLIEGTTLYFEYDKYILYQDNPAVCEFNSSAITEIGNSTKVALSTTQDEALADAKEMNIIEKEKVQMHIEEVKNGILKGIKIIQDATAVNFSFISKAVEQLNQFKGDEFNNFRRVIYCADYYSGDDVVSEDVVNEIRRIYRQHGFEFIDDDNDGIHTWVNLDKAVSIETDSICNDKECIRIIMSDDVTFNVYKMTEGDLYRALETLYE